MPAPPPLLAVPNVSEGRDRSAIDAIAAATTCAGVRLLDVHSDPDHHRSVLTLAGAPGTLAPALLAGASEAVARIDLREPRGVHPHVGAIDVVPIVHLDQRTQGAACAEALLVADLIGAELRVPVLLYGVLAGGRTRAQLRQGGVATLAARLASGELAADFGPRAAHPTAGVTLVAARPPLVAFNFVLAPPAGIETARRIAALIREGGGEGLPGVRALGLPLASRSNAAAATTPPSSAAQVSLNIEDPLAVPVARALEVIARHADIEEAELVGLAPRAALSGLPEGLLLRGFDPARHVIEQAVGAGGKDCANRAVRRPVTL